MSVTARHRAPGRTARDPWPSLRNIGKWITYLFGGVALAFATAIVSIPLMLITLYGITELVSALL